MAWKLKAAAALLAVSLAGPLQAQAPEKGKLLVATEDMRDPNYRETVVLLLHHDEGGTIGVAVNRPTWLAPEEVVTEIGAIEGFDGKVFRGGPIGSTQLIYLVRDPPPGTFDAPPILDGIHASGNLELVQQLAAGAEGDRGLRLFAGHSEWTAGQLQREIARGQWVVVDASEDRVFSPPGDLWRRMLTSGSELLVDEDDEPAVSPLARRGE
jgi:putative transcriptional regulator